MTVATDIDDEIPETDDRDAAQLIPEAVERILALAATWLGWDGSPIVGDGNVWTPHKALRRVQDHLLDHHAQITAMLAGQPTVPDTWHGRAVTVDSDWARFTELDLEETTSRLSRYAELYRITVAGLPVETLDADWPDAWTIRQIVHHVANVTYYAEQVGDLSAGS